ncbi:hypothetical protein SUGI_1176840 [Cryptomeria japonica]|uniref:uncharacterized protein LOC131050880 n=1 Tax=Cryptomeria japonica TaxID=3369 RepID=UPI002414C608|nr:uncharacterized protein LOC131050880 [Cryptomeria japonica]GLJ54790.1 hypothetical protein SUGI_1176840 [Cryptomeria japonica]
MGVHLPEKCPFSVDTWTPNSSRKKCHFLTHAHKDHTVGILSYASYPIYCTFITKQLILLRYPTLDESLFLELEVEEPVLINDDEQPFTVTAFDANHCPGAIMLYFEGQFGNVLHTGDCRLSSDCLSKLPCMLTLKNSKVSRDCLDCLYLDCTFGKESFKMPIKYCAVNQVIRCIWKHPSASPVYLACDLLGQEEILMEISKTFGSKIYVDKSSIPEYHAIVSFLVPELLTEDTSCRFHVCEGFPKLYERAKAKFAMAEKSGQPKPLFIRPSTQWYICEEKLEGIGSDLIPLPIISKRQTQSVPKEAERDQFGVWHVCFSMHSSKEELEEALMVLSPKEVISTTPNCKATELQYVRKKIGNTRIWSQNDSDLQSRTTNTFCQASSISGIKQDMVNDATTFHVSNQVSFISERERNTDVIVALEEKHSHTHVQFSSPVKPIPLFGITRYSLPPSPPMSFTDGEDTFSSPDCKISLNDAGPLSPSHLPEDVKHFMSGGKNTSQFTLSVRARKLEDESRSCKDHVADCIQSSGRSALHINEEVEKPNILSGHSEKGEHPLDFTDHPSPKKDGASDSEQVGCIQSYMIEGSSLSFDSHCKYPRSLHENVRKMYRSLHVPIPQPLPSLLDLANITKRPKFRYSQS